MNPIEKLYQLLYQTRSPHVAFLMMRKRPGQDEDYLRVEGTTGKRVVVLWNPKLFQFESRPELPSTVVGQKYPAYTVMQGILKAIQ